MVDYVVMARNIGAKIIGGCCGIMPEPLDKMRTALQTRAPDQAPSLQEIEEILGAFPSTNDGTCPSYQIKKYVRRRRRSA